MILRPVRPASPIGPPVTKRPVGLTCMTGSVGRSDLSIVGRMTRSMISVRRRSARTSGSCCAETTTVRTRLGTPRSYSTVTWVLPSGRRYGSSPRLADLGQAARHAVREGDRQRHQLGRLAAGEAEHHPLVAGAQLVVRRLVVADLERLVDAHRDVGRLLLDRHERAAGQVVEAVVGAGVADVADGVADDRLEVDVGRRA